jgi:hypothetical protein
MIQTATTPEQSERLLQLGVPASTADMEYCMGALRVKRPEGCADNDSVKTPAWSLSALLELLPTRYERDDYIAEIVKVDKSLFLSNFMDGTNPLSPFEMLRQVATPEPIEGIVLIIEWLVTNGYPLNNSKYNQHTTTH